MITNIEMIKQLTTQSIDRLKQDLITLIAQKNSPGRIRGGTSIEKQNIILGLISYTPHSDPEEESIEFSIRTEINAKTSIVADICWSDGEAVDVVLKEQLVFDSHDDLRIQLVAIWKKLFPIILNKLTKFINRNQPPRYRTD